MHTPTADEHHYNIEDLTLSDAITFFLGLELATSRPQTKDWYEKRLYLFKKRNYRFKRVNLLFIYIEQPTRFNRNKNFFSTLLV